MCGLHGTDASHQHRLPTQHQATFPGSQALLRMHCSILRLILELTWDHSCVTEKELRPRILRPRTLAF